MKGYSRAGEGKKKGCSLASRLSCTAAKSMAAASQAQGHRGLGKASGLKLMLNPAVDLLGKCLGLELLESISFLFILISLCVFPCASLR